MISNFKPLMCLYASLRTTIEDVWATRCVGPLIFNLYWMEIVCLLALFALSFSRNAPGVSKVCTGWVPQRPVKNG